MKIICLTEESVETIHLLGKAHLIVGVSQFVKRPKEALSHPKVSFFTSAQYEKIEKLKPDLILGHSDIQKDMARDLIERGHNVFIANHRSIEGILTYVEWLSRLIDAKAEGIKLISDLKFKIETIQTKVKKMQTPRPRVYFEEWDDPMISAIEWVSEMIEISGGENIFADRAKGILAKDRFVNKEEIIQKDPEIIMGCWCGKKVKKESFKKRFPEVLAVQKEKIFEGAPEVFLQPGPAPILDGLDILFEIFHT